jgi:TolA-binding protein
MTGTVRDPAELDGMLQAVSADLAGDGAPRPEDEALIRRAIDRAMARAVPVSPRAAGIRSPRWRRGVLLAAAALIVTSTALALMERARMRRSEHVGMTSAPAQVLSPIRTPPTTPQPPAVESPLAEAPPAATPEPPLTTSTQPDAAELFSQANEARRRGDAPNALRRYAELQRRFPRSPEAALSQVALGRLYLDRLNDPGRALSQFDAYLAAAGNDGLREEALVGRALALQRLGRASEEKQAWRALLDAYPGSLSSDRAKARLDELH